MMDRRLFFKKSCLGVLLLGASGFASCKLKRSIRFGMVTDSHFAGRETSNARYYNRSIDKLNEAIAVFNDEKPDFIIELGDFKDQGIIPDRRETLHFLDQIEKTFREFNGLVYHVLGNHDMDSISKQDFLDHTENHGSAKGKTYYSFVVGDVKFIVLDANFNEDGSDYEQGNFHWTKARIPESQKKWLEKELDDKRPVIVFSHQLLDAFSGVNKNVCILNADEIVDILERNNNVLTVFQGHHHEGNYSFRNGIHYYTMKAMVTGDFPGNNSFAIVEIDPDLNISITGFYNCEDKILNSSS